MFSTSISTENSVWKKFLQLAFKNSDSTSNDAVSSALPLDNGFTKLIIPKHDLQQNLAGRIVKVDNSPKTENYSIASILVEHGPHPLMGKTVQFLAESRVYKGQEIAVNIYQSTTTEHFGTVYKADGLVIDRPATAQRIISALNRDF